MPEIYNIDESWQEQSWFSTGGTRAKKYILSPHGKYYYFKRSQYKESINGKPGKDFKYEFWSEIIAYEVGLLLGFNVLRYDLAIDVESETIGCICESMINSETEDLIEGIKYLQAYDPSFNPEVNANRIQYSFQLIENTLSTFKLDVFINQFLEMLVFDSLIGNGDRHQENWAVIVDRSFVSLNEFEHIMREFEKFKAPRLVKRFFGVIYDWKKRKVKPDIAKIVLTKNAKNNKVFAPLYDNGSSLGRELVKTRVSHLAYNDDEIIRYVNKGLSEIHWNGEKLSHFELLKKLLETSYNETLKNSINRVIMLFDGQKIENIVKNVDNLVPEGFYDYKIPDDRKMLIIKLITLRFEKLRSLINEGV